MSASLRTKLASMMLLFIGANLSACSGSDTSLPAARLGAQKTAWAAFTMHWPKKTSASSKRPLYISPSTRSVLVEVNNDPSLLTKLNMPTSPGAPSTSTVTIDAPVGVDSFTISTWDQADGTGRELGQITVSQSITAGIANTLNATVDGIMTAAGISANPNPMLEQAPDASGKLTFTLVGDAPQTFTVVPEDSDKNIIVPPGDAPSLTMSSSDPQVLNLTPVVGRSDVYTLSVTAAPPIGEPLSVKIKGTDGLGNSLSAQYHVDVSAAIYVGYKGPTSSSIVVYDQKGKALSVPGTFPGFVEPTALAYDGDDKRIFLVDSVLGALVAFDTQGNAINGFNPTAADVPTGIAYDSGTKNLYVSQGNPVDNVKVFNVSGQPQNVPGTFPGLYAPTAIAYDANPQNEQLYVSDSDPSGAGIIVPYNGDGTGSAWPLLQYSGPDGFLQNGVAYDSATDNIYAIGRAVYSAGPVSAGQYSVREFIPNFNGSFNSCWTGLNSPSAIAYNPVDQKLYVTNAGDNSISIYQASVYINGGIIQDSSVKFVPPNGQTRPLSIAIVY